MAKKGKKYQEAYKVAQNIRIRNLQQNCFNEINNAKQALRL